MSIQTVFKRYELKYIMDDFQKGKILEAMRPYMKLDQYGHTTIRNIYYDTDDFRLARRSIEKPVYKEKLRVRSYAQAKSDTTVFVELKKKYESIVYKRRILLAEREAMEWIKSGKTDAVNCQISREIDYFLNYYGALRPAAFLTYEREAYFTGENDFRITFDENIRFRDTEMSLTMPVGGELLLPEGMTLMEIKCSGGIPLWMTHALSENNIYKTSYSKYGTAYSRFISKKYKEDVFYA